MWKCKKCKAIIWFHRKRRSNIEDRANPSQPGGPSSRARRIDIDVDVGVAIDIDVDCHIDIEIDIGIHIDDAVDDDVDVDDDS